MWVSATRHSIVRRCAVIVVAAALLGAGTERAVAVDEHAHHREMTEAQRGRYTRSEVRYEVPDVSLVDVEGRTTSLRSELAAGTPVMLNFVFTTCTTICPAMSAIFADVQQQLEPDEGALRLVSISIDPEQDTPAKLKAYAGRFHAGAGWHLLTGKSADVIAAARAFGAWRGDKTNHTPATYLRAATGNTWVRVDGFASAAELVREYRGLAAGGGGGPPRP